MITARRAWWVWVVGTLAACAHGGGAAGEPELAPDPKLDELLTSQESPGLQPFAELGPRTAARLRRIAEDGDRDLVVRGRAVTALQAFPSDPLSESWLQVLVMAEEAPPLLRRKAEHVLSKWGAHPSTLTETSGN